MIKYTAHKIYTLAQNWDLDCLSMYCKISILALLDCYIRVFVATFYSSLEHFQEEFEDVSKEDQVISNTVI